MLEQDLEINLSNDLNLGALKTKALDLITKSTAKASAIAAIPIPLLDIGGITYVQMSMVKKLAEIYGVDSNSQEKLILSTVLSSLGATLISEALSSLTASTQLEKIVSESLIKASVAGVLTTITGEVYNEHFAQGGNLQDINLDSYIAYIKNQLKSDRLSTEVLGSKLIDSVMNKFGL